MSDPLGERAELPGFLAERYRLDAVLGQGISGWVARAHDRHLDRDVAIKVFHRSFLRDAPNAVERFRREARYAARIRHPRVARVYDQGVTDETLFILYELIEGQTLGQHFLRRGPLPVPEATRFLVQLLEAVAALEAAEIVHRDLKPANVLVSPEGDLVVTDLGLARSSLDDTITRTGGIVGTVTTMPPEQMEGGEPGHDWDLYAAASIYWELLTGEPPFAGRSLVETRERKAEGLTSGLRDQGFDVPEELDAMVLRMLAADRSRRPRSAAAPLEVTRRALASPGAAPESSSPGPGPRPPEGDEPAAPLPRSSPPPPRTPPSAKAPGRAPLAGRVPPWVLGAGAAILLVGVFLAGRLTAPERGAPAASGSSEAGETTGEAGHDAALEALAATRARVDTAPAIRSFLALTVKTPTAEAEQSWLQARETFQELVGHITAAVHVLRGAPPSLRIHEDAARLRFLELLLTEIGTDRSAPLDWPGDAPDLAGLLERSLQVVPSPALSGRRRPSPRPGQDLEFRGTLVDRLRSRLPGGREAWFNLFDYHAPWGMDRPKTRSHTLLPRGPTERPFEAIDAPGGADFLSGMFRAREDYRGAPDEAILDLERAPGDLDLAVLTASWPVKILLTLEVWTAAGTRAVFPIQVPPPEELLPAPEEGIPRDENPISGLLVRIPRGLLGSEPRWLRLVARGIQPVGNPSFSVWLLDVHQRIAIPPPPELERALADAR